MNTVTTETVTVPRYLIEDVIKSLDRIIERLPKE